MVSTVAAAQPDHELTPDIAVKLVQLLSGNFPERINIGAIVEGTSKACPFESTNARQIVCIHPVPENGSRVRRVRIYDFFWSPDYGWFTWEKGEESGGDVIKIWSETRGAIVIK